MIFTVDEHGARLDLGHGAHAPVGPGWVVGVSDGRASTEHFLAATDFTDLSLSRDELVVRHDESGAVYHFDLRRYVMATIVEHDGHMTVVAGHPARMAQDSSSS